MKTFLLLCLSLLMACTLISDDTIQLFVKIHPYAFYCLNGGDFYISDTDDPVLAVDISIFKLDKSLQKQYNMELLKEVKTNELGANYLNRKGKLCGGFIFCRFIKSLPKSNKFIILCSESGGGSLISDNYLLLKRQKILYFTAEQEKCVELLIREAVWKNFSSEKYLDITKQLSEMTPEIMLKKNIPHIPISDIHPYAFYLLSRGSDKTNIPHKGIMEVNATKFRLSNETNEVCHKQPYTKKQCFGFTYDKENDDELIAQDNFYFSAYKELKGNYYVIKCVFQRGRNQPEIDYILVKKYYKYHYSFSKGTIVETLRRCGEFGSNPPTSSDIKRIEDCIATRNME